MSERIPLIAGNWKMNLNHVEAAGLVQKLAWTLADMKYDPAKSECAVIVPYTDIRTVQTLIEGDQLPLRFGAQNCSPHMWGPYTGEISSGMLAKLNCTYVILGHSERRQYHSDNDSLVNLKAQLVFRAGMTPIVCVGEDLAIRRRGEHVQHVLSQVRTCLATLEPAWVASMVIAYEPIWAIGTGEVATAEDAQEVCGAIRQLVSALFGPEVAAKIRIQYGGSVRAANIRDIMAQPDVDGALVGGASLDAEEFATITMFYV